MRLHQEGVVIERDRGTEVLGCNRTPPSLRPAVGRANLAMKVKLKDIENLCHPRKLGVLVAARFILLNLLFCHTKSVSKLTLGPPASYSSFDEHIRYVVERI